LCPSVWGPVQKGEDPYAAQGGGGGCCTIQVRNHSVHHHRVRKIGLTLLLRVRSDRFPTHRLHGLPVSSFVVAFTLLPTRLTFQSSRPISTQHHRLHFLDAIYPHLQPPNLALREGSPTTPLELPHANLDTPCSSAHPRARSHSPPLAHGLDKLLFPITSLVFSPSPVLLGRLAMFSFGSRRSV